MLRIVPLGGFLGAGKTTTMLAAARRLEAAGERVAVITNDQGTDLVDTALAADLPGAEVTGGCFCCRFDDLAAAITRLRETTDPSVVLAEAVGSCTDLQSTVVRPLRRFYGAELRVSPLAVLVDPLRYAAISRSWLPLADEPDLSYLYRHQLDEADVIAVNKVDLLADGEADRVVAELTERFPHARVLTLSARTGAGLDALVDVWRADGGADRRAFDVDYDRYGAAEAELAWTNQTFVLAGPVSPSRWVERFVEAFGRVSDGAGIGHVKVLATGPRGSAKASLVGAGAPSFDRSQSEPDDPVTVTLNARVQVAPDELSELIAAAVRSADDASGVASGPRSGDIFRPGFPVPVHRL